MEALISSRVSVGELAPPPTMELQPPSSSPRKYSLPPASTDRCTRNRSSSTATVTSQNWPHRYCETIAAGSAVPPSRMAVGDGTAAGSVRARFEGRFDMAEDDRRTKVLDPRRGARARPNLRGGCRNGERQLEPQNSRVIRTRLVGGAFRAGFLINSPVLIFQTRRKPSAPMLRVAAKLMPIVLLFLPRAQAVVFSSPESGLAEILEVERSLTFPGWRRLAERTRGLYTRHPTLVPQYLKLMRLKQRLHDGDRSDPRFVALDTLKGSLSYPGWRGDAAKAEMWRGAVGLLDLGLGGIGDDHAVAAMRRKQELHEAHPPSLVSAACRSGASRVARVFDATGERFGTLAVMLLWCAAYASAASALASPLARALQALLNA